MSEQFKTCRVCGLPLPISAFTPKAGGKYGVMSKCRQCMNEIKRQRYRAKTAKTAKTIVKTVKTPAGLRTRTVWPADDRFHPPVDAWRNDRCPHYRDCLWTAAGHNLDFSCRGCQFEAAGESLPPWDGELAGMIGLLLVVLADVDAPDCAEVANRVAGRLPEFVSYLAGERIRDRDAEHWGRPGPD